jgi:hypothetical protein
MQPHDPYNLWFMAVLAAAQILGSRWINGTQAVNLIGKAAERFAGVPELELEGEAEAAAKRRFLNPTGLLVLLVFLVLWKVAFSSPWWLRSRYPQLPDRWGYGVMLLPLLAGIFLVNWWARHYVVRELLTRFPESK